MDLVIWCGPVFGPGNSPHPEGDIGRVQWPNETRILSLPCVGGACGDIAAANRGSDGRILPNLLARHGYGAPADYASIALAGYSAGHNLMNPLLQSDGDLIAAMVSIDACYSATNPPWTKKGYVEFGAMAARGDKRMVLMSTGSSHGGAGYPSSSGSECAIANFEAAAELAGVTPSTMRSGLPYDPTTTLRAGELVLLDYALQQFGPEIPHWYAINLLSVDVLQEYLAPYLGGKRLGLSWLGIPWWGWALGALGMLGAGAAGVAIAQRASKSADP